MIGLRGFLATGTILTAIGTAFSTPAHAQVAPTEVNEEAVDEFGLERKTGRFSWSTDEIIGIGGEGGRLSLSVAGIRNPARATRTWPLPAFNVILNEPRLISTPLEDSNSTIPGAILPNAFQHTVEGVEGSESFNCALQCYSEYFTGSSLLQIGETLLFSNRNGVQAIFGEYETKVIFPDGREQYFRSGGYRRNNFGFLLKQSGSSFTAINQAIDYCDEQGAQACVGSQDRSASIVTPGVGTEEITDAVGQTTTLSWQSKSAKLFKIPSNSSPSVQVPSRTERYPVGIRLPGSSSDDIVISYESHDPDVDTHDDIVVSSITKHGITASYSHDRVFPYGELPEVDPIVHAIEAANSKLDGPFQAERLLLEAECGGLVQTRTETRIDPNTGLEYEVRLPSFGESFLACQQLDAAIAREDALNNAIMSQSENQLPPRLRDPEAPGTLVGKIYELTITRQIGSEPATVSHAIKPAGFFGAKRRRLLYVTDENGRTTQYRYNQFEEIGGVSAPEGNSVLEGRDGRGNLVSRTTYPKSEAHSASPLTTVWTYPASCDGLTLARCNKPLSMTDPNGNVSDYTYNNRGQLTREVGPAPSPGAARPTVVNEYTMRTAYIKGSDGSVVPAGAAISMLTRSFTCISAASCDENTSASEKVVTDFHYGPTTGLNNLLLRGISVTAFNNATNQIETLTTCYTYNYFGERIAETQPKAGLTSCP